MTSIAWIPTSLAEVLMSSTRFQRVYILYFWDCSSWLVRWASWQRAGGFNNILISIWPLELQRATGLIHRFAALLFITYFGTGFHCRYMTRTQSLPNECVRYFSYSPKAYRILWTVEDQCGCYILTTVDLCWEWVERDEWSRFLGRGTWGIKTGSGHSQFTFSRTINLVCSVFDVCCRTLAICYLISVLRDWDAGFS